MAVIVLRVLTTHVNVQFTLLVQVENSRIPVGARFQAPLLTVYDEVCKSADTTMSHKKMRHKKAEAENVRLEFVVQFPARIITLRYVERLRIKIKPASDSVGW